MTKMSLSKSENSVKICELLNRCESTNYARRKIMHDVHAFINAMHFVSVFFGGGKYIPQYLSGSRKDGSSIQPLSEDEKTYTLQSDTDVLEVLPDVYVFNDVSNEHKSNSNIQDKWAFQMVKCCNPLFVTLKLDHSRLCERGKPTLSQSVIPNFTHLLVGGLPSAELLNNYAKFHTTGGCGMGYLAAIERQLSIEGPSCQNTAKVHYLDYSVYGDEVLCLLVSDWPKECKEWTGRKLNTKWLDVNFRKTITESCQCLLVPIGRPTCKNKDKEWRISFSTVEEKLIRCFNETQFYCFFLLKILLKENNVKLCNSYMVKTLMFWTLEWDNDIEWCNCNLISGMLRVLSRLYCGILTGFIPHFFAPSHNLLDGKINALNLGPSLNDIQTVFLKVSCRDLIQYSTYLGKLATYTAGLTQQWYCLDSITWHILYSFYMQCHSCMIQLPSLHKSRNFTWDYFEFKEKDCKHYKKLINIHGFTGQDFAQWFKLYSQMKAKLQFWEDRNLPNIDDLVREPAPFINQCHRHIKFALWYMSRNDFTNTKYHLNKALNLSVSKCLTLNSLPQIRVSTDNVIPALKELVSIFKNNHSIKIQGKLSYTVRSNDQMWQDWCENRQSVFDGSLVQTVPFLREDIPILPSCLQYDLFLQLSRYKRHMLILPSLPLTLLLKTILYLKEKSNKANVSQKEDMELSLVALAYVDAYIPLIHHFDAWNLLTIAQLQLKKKSFAIEFAMFTARLNPDVSFSVDFVQYILKCIG